MDTNIKPELAEELLSRALDDNRKLEEQLKLKQQIIEAQDAFILSQKETIKRCEEFVQSLKGE